jgi:hypothetical protein
VTGAFRSIASPRAAALAVIIGTSLTSASASAFQLEGHETIEAAAYKRLLSLPHVLGTGSPGISGRQLLAALIVDGVLRPPPCFDAAHPEGTCRLEDRTELPLRFWPTLGSGTPDVVIDRQIGERGQCQHFMARTGDGLSPVDPGLGVPRSLATDAYTRCASIAGAVFAGILRNPALAQSRLAGMYVLMHAVEDSFSPAHVARDERFQIIHLLSWTLIDWPIYAWHWRFSFPPSTHHGVSDRRDHEYLRSDGLARDGRRCRTFQNPYAVPEECLTERARAAVDAVVDLLVLTYRLRTSGAVEASSSTPPANPPVNPEMPVGTGSWLGFGRAHLASIVEPLPARAETRGPLPRPDVFVGVQALAGPHLVGVGLWATDLSFRAALPFALGFTGSAGFVRADGRDTLGASAGVSLLLPLVRRFTIGATPAAVTLSCDVRFHSCSPDLEAVLGVVLVPLGDRTWLGLEGPHWSWETRSVGESWAGLAVGMSHERTTDRRPVDPAAALSWNPPRPDEVEAFRSTRSSRSIFLSTTVFSRSDNQFVGVGLAWRRDRDAWNRRAGIAPGLELGVEGGRIDGTTPGGALVAAPTVDIYVLPDQLALTATPALLHYGAIAERALALDVAARAGVRIDIARVEFEVDAPPLSYVSESRWHPLPITARLGVEID